MVWRYDFIYDSEYSVFSLLIFYISKRQSMTKDVLPYCLKIHQISQNLSSTQERDLKLNDPE